MFDTLCGAVSRNIVIFEIATNKNGFFFIAFDVQKSQKYHFCVLCDDAILIFCMVSRALLDLILGTLSII